MLVLQKEYCQQNNNTDVHDDQLDHIIQVVKGELVDYDINDHSDWDERWVFDALVYFLVFDKLETQEGLDEDEQGEDAEGAEGEGDENRAFLYETGAEEGLFLAVE